jgi:hypothetical protein
VFFFAATTVWRWAVSPDSGAFVNCRFAQGALLLNKHKLRAVEDFGKHLFYNFGKDRLLHVHRRKNLT